MTKQSKIYVRFIEGTHYSAPVSAVGFSNGNYLILDDPIYDFEDWSFCAEFIPGDTVKVQEIENRLEAFELVIGSDNPNLKNEFKWHLLNNHLEIVNDNIGKYKLIIRELIEGQKAGKLFQYPIKEWLDNSGQFSVKDF